MTKTAVRHKDYAISVSGGILVTIHPLRNMRENQAGNLFTD